MEDIQYLRELGEGIPRRIREYSCKTPAMAPPAQYSGIVIDDKTYPTVLLSSGDYGYFGEDGRIYKVPKNTDNFTRKFVDISRGDIEYSLEMYLTPGGKALIEAARSYDEEIHTLKSSYVVIQSTDPAVVVGTHMEELPNNWTRVPNDFPDLTTRQIIPVKQCYASSDKKVYVEGNICYNALMIAQSYDLTVLESNAEDIPVGTHWNGIPTGWTLSKCNCNC